jgi:polyhydroxybutyrate depolymerase
MVIKILRLSCIAFLILIMQSFVPSKSTARIGLAKKQSNPIELKWTINGVERKALAYIPASAKTKSTAVVFAFHGHGGTMGNMYRTRRFDLLWEDAIFICPQGLNTVGKLTDPEGKLPGWQMDGDDATNKDLLFFDAMLKTIQETYNVDKKRIFVTGHSNGGGFTYLLWATRGDVFAAVAPTASTAVQLVSRFKPKPAFHLMGENDPLVKPAGQKLTCNLVMKLNGCSTVGEKIDEFQTRYASASGNPFVMYVHPGGHNYPLGANKAIVSFFKEIGNSNH